MTLTRNDRRRMRRHADSLAAALAATALCGDEGGALRPITDPLARGVLRRGFAAMIRNGCAPVVHRLSDAEARALPGFCETPPGAAWWCGFGLDVEQRATWVARWSCAEGMTEAEVADAAEVVVLEALARECNRPGIGQGVAP